MLNEITLGKFKANLRGELIQRSDERYEEARKLYNGMIDKRPLLIARAGRHRLGPLPGRFLRDHLRKLLAYVPVSVSHLFGWGFLICIDE